ncbi:MAG: radical SAM protein [Planctomycetota bacterium]
MCLVRYAKFTGNMPREVVLLKGLPCIWGRCRFCDYIDDNTSDEDLIRSVAEENLAKVTGEFGRLQAINSGSIQELPRSIWTLLRDLIATKGISQFFTESYWAYRKEFAVAREFFGVDTHLFLGVETFDDHLRNAVLNKSMHWSGPDDVALLTDAICLMVGFKGQTHDTVRRDIDLLLSKFKYGIVNVFTENRVNTDMVDNDLDAWFKEEFAWLAERPNVNVLWKNTDFGVG